MKKNIIDKNLDSILEASGIQDAKERQDYLNTFYNGVFDAVLQKSINTLSNNKRKELKRLLENNEGHEDVENIFKEVSGKDNWQKVFEETVRKELEFFLASILASCDKHQYVKATKIIKDDIYTNEAMGLGKD